MHDTYRAFISYSHADEAWASWLQRALERYRIPARLRSARPGLPRRLYPVFRDREELASSSDLGESIRAALARAEALVVICSPAAAGSRWVNEEVRLFRAIAPDRPILTLLVSGSPDAQAADCAFPPAILLDEDGNALPEPLASDAREHADGRRGALLKIVAGLLGVGIDALRQRDQQRRMRAATGLAAVASLIALVTLALAVNTQLARQEAELRRDQAEGLIGFMLGDLRSRLEPLGRLDVLDAVGDQAMAYFAQLGDKGSEEEVLARAMALRQIGEVRFAQGQLEEALDAFTESHEIASALQAQYPDRAHYLFELGQAEFWVGYTAWEQDRLDVAGESMQAYMSHTRALLEREPANADYRLELAYAFANLGAIARQQRDPALALQHFQASIQTTQPLSDAAPDDTRLLMLIAESWSWTGSTLLDLGRLADAEEAFYTALRYAAGAHALSESPVHQEEMADLAMFLADVHLKQGELEPGLEQLRNALEIQEALARHDPANARWLWAHYRTKRQLAELATLGAWSGDDQAQIAAVIDGLRALVDRDHSAADFRRELALALRVQALVALSAGSRLSALSWAEQAREALAVGEIDLGASGTQAAIVGETLGLASATTGDMQRARAAWDAALAALPEASRQDLQQKAMFARLTTHLGRPEDALAAITELRALGYADPRFPLPVAAD